MKTFSTITLLALPFGAFGIHSFFPREKETISEARTNLNLALQVTSPGEDAVWNSTGSHTITWSSVS
jgi:hypothetical protein